MPLPLRKENILALRKRKNEPVAAETVSTPQTGSRNGSFTGLASYVPYGECDFALYAALREAIPIIDAAIMKTVRLLGSFRVTCEDEKAQKHLDSFLQNVNVGGTRQGIDAFVSTFFEQLITYGTAIGEMVVTESSISHLYNSDLKSVSLSRGSSPLDIVVSSDCGNGICKPVPYPSLILLATHNPEPGRIYGTSLLRGLPFVSEILLKIYNTIGINWERLGNVRFAVTYKPQNDAIDKAYAKERAMQVAKEWSRTMQSDGAVRDFVAVGDVSVKAIGADNQILDSDVPVKQLLEQIVAKLGIPPFLLGLSWSSTERMSYQQADILTSEIDFYRREITPVIRKICNTCLRLSGYCCDFTLEWDSITLQDISELAKSRHYDALTQQILSQTGGNDTE